MTDTSDKWLLVLGGGFAGVWAALAAAREADLAGAELDITLVSRDAYLTMRPRLYEAHPETLRAPLAPTLDPVGVRFVEGEIENIDAVERQVTLRGRGDSSPYDRMVLAVGSQLAAPPVTGWAEHAWSIDDHASAVAFDAHLAKLCAEKTDPAGETFVIIGGGFTGIELATEMRDRLAVHGADALANACRVIMVDRASVPGASLGDGPRAEIEAALASAGIETRLGREIAGLGPGEVTLSDGERIAARTVIATTGLRANPIAAQLSDDLAPDGRLPVDDMLRVAGVSAIFAAGDMAHARVDDSNYALMSCQHALYMGRADGRNAARELLGLGPEAYRQRIT